MDARSGQRRFTPDSKGIDKVKKYLVIGTSTTDDKCAIWYIFESVDDEGAKKQFERVNKNAKYAKYVELVDITDSKPRHVIHLGITR